MRTDKQKKTRFFDRLSLNFNRVKACFPNLRVSPDIPDMVPCPLCFRVFPSYPDALTLEHAPPSRLGGKVTALTCQDCNNRQGSALESKLVEYYMVKESLTGNSTRVTDAVVQVNGLPPIRAAVNFVDGNWSIVPVNKASNPKTLEATKQEFVETTGPVTFRIQVQHPSLRPVRIALIRAAYLIAFGRFGYGFVVNPGLNYVRELFRDPDNASRFPHGVMFDLEWPDEFLGVSIITQPVEMRSYLVVFDLFDRQKQIDRVGVVLPGWTHNPLPLYTYLDSISGQKTSVSISKTEYEGDLLLEKPCAALDHWNVLFDGQSW